ncbi:hypothetical protein SSX86_026896 [Deinandra increscens subsp. villosa]|uniref:Zinc metalloproteinase aureolysin n=1 Tax=Deinandra increscens subsp. villosa TaxID=3103831 RepID=A0AAP0CFQ2_9ASTR
MPPISLSRLGSSLPFTGFFRQVEQEMETVVKVFQPGPLGIVEHKFSAEEIEKANATVKRAVENWKRNAIIERNRPILKDYLN